MTARWIRFGWKSSLAAITILMGGAGVVSMSVPRAAADETPGWSETQGAKPLQIAMELAPDDGDGNANVVMLLGDLIRVRLDWRLAPNRDALESAVQFRSAPKPAPAVRLWADVEQSVEIFAETTGVGGSPPTLFNLADLPTSLWLEPADSGTLKIEMKPVRR